MNIQQMQRLYLQTKDEKHLQELYKMLIALGRKQQNAEPGLPQDPDVVVDIAGGVCLRLLEKQQPIIKKPSSYMLHALKYYRNTGKVLEDIEDYQELQGPVYQTSSDQDECVTEILEDCGIDTDTELGALVEQTLLARVKWTAVNKGLLAPDRRKFEQMMETVYNGIKNRLQSSGMYSSDRQIRWHKILRRASKPRGKRQRAERVLHNGSWDVGRAVSESEVEGAQEDSASISAVM